ncbi:Uncharacterised protein [Mycobacteroides abscessus subsp. abscessus]|nr:Uncharacterised protein [Mycobacteroides abscessus subsp. abscessus]
MQHQHHGSVRHAGTHQLGQLCRRVQLGHRWHIGPARLPRRCLGDGFPAAPALFCLVRIPARHAPPRLPRDHFIGTGLYRQIDRQLGAIRFGKCLHHSHFGVNGGNTPAPGHVDCQAGAVNGRNDAVPDLTGTVAHHHRLADSHAQHPRRVVALIPVEQHLLPG